MTSRNGSQPKTKQRVYYIQNTENGFIKIGVSEDPWARVKELQTGAHAPLILLGTTEGGIQMERGLHRQFAKYRTNAEWFSPSPELMTHIEWETGQGSTEHSLKVGYWVALTLRAETAPGRCYVGRISALDSRGVRITLIDWIIGRATGFDFFVAWDNLVSALIATPEHAMDEFGEAAARWQGQCNKMGGKEGETDD